MESRTLVGRWSGRYTYDPMPDILKLPTIEFALEINSEFTGRFRGTVQDDLATGGRSRELLRDNLAVIECYSSNGCRSYTFWSRIGSAMLPSVFASGGD